MLHVKKTSGKPRMFAISLLGALLSVWILKDPVSAKGWKYSRSCVNGIDRDNASVLFGCRLLGQKNSMNVG